MKPLKQRVLAKAGVMSRAELGPLIEKLAAVAEVLIMHTCKRENCQDKSCKAISDLEKEIK